jgi:hypothetical protein
LRAPPHAGLGHSVQLHVERLREGRGGTTRHVLEDVADRVSFAKIDDWHNAKGFLLYMGADRRRWRTDFSTQIENKVVVMRVADTREVLPNDLPSVSN